LKRLLGAQVVVTGLKAGVNGNGILAKSGVTHFSRNCEVSNGVAVDDQ